MSEKLERKELLKALAILIKDPSGKAIASKVDVEELEGMEIKDLREKWFDFIYTADKKKGNNEMPEIVLAVFQQQLDRDSTAKDEDLDEWPEYKSLFENGKESAPVKKGKKEEPKKKEVATKSKKEEKKPERSDPVDRKKEKKEEPKKKEVATKSKKVEKAPAKKEEPKKKRAVEEEEEEITPKKKAPVKKEKAEKRVRTEPKGKDDFGFREGSKASKIAGFMNVGKYTMGQIAEKVGHSPYYMFDRLMAKGFKINTDDKGRVSLSKKK
jgi:hypothetical protein